MPHRFGVARCVRFYFDYSSPFAYLGSTQIERVAREAGGSIEWRPFLLGALFRAIGTPNVPLLAMPAPKQHYQRLELDRWARHWDVPFTFTTHFPLRTVDALRLTLLAPDDRKVALIHRLMRAAWVEDLDLADATVLAACARDASVEEGLLERTADAREALRGATDEAVQAGCPGAPCFVVDGELFWGQDRLELVGDALARVAS
jgi:2-hydroxychromene-2-carboxylate isomerase